MRTKKIRVLSITALVGDTERYINENDKPRCARCDNVKKMKRQVVLTQFGMFEDICTVVYKCPQCLECTAFTYRIELEVKEIVND